MTAAFGGHAGTKTVSSLALDDAGLESSFHRNCPIGLLTPRSGEPLLDAAAWESLEKGAPF